MRLDVRPSLVSSDYPFTHRIRVRFAETDAMGIVHHANYLLYLEEARVEYLRSLDRPYAALRAEGVEHAVLECALQYRRPLRFDELVDVHLALASTTRATFQMACLLTVDGQIRASAVTVHGCVDLHGRPTRMPAWLRDLVVDQHGAASDSTVKPN